MQGNKKILYDKLILHCKKQYKDVETINKAYIIDKKVYAIDYVSKSGINCIASNTFEAELIIDFKN